MGPRADDTRFLPTDGGFSAIPPAPFGKYVLVARLGRGGMADVFLAIASGMAGFRKLVVIKKLRAELGEDRAFEQMFLDEARLAARLSHPNVVATLEVGEEDSRPFLTMEHIEGQTVGRLLRRRRGAKKALPAPIVMHIVSEVLEGLAYAHELKDFDGKTELGVIHRDVAPANIMITYDGVVKLLDFGVAKARTQISKTDPNKRKGKFAYIAPEQVHGTPDQRSDLFSLGVVLWEALANRRLFSSKVPARTLKNALEMPIPRMERKDLPRGLEALTRKALSRDPEKRYQSARQMRRALDDLRRAEDVMLRRVDVAEFMQKEVGELKAAHRHVLEQCIEQGLAHRAHAEEPEPEEAVGTPIVAESTRARNRWLAIGGGVLGVSLLSLVVWVSSGDDPAVVPPPAEPSPPATPAPPPAAPTEVEIDTEAFDAAREEGRTRFRAGEFEAAAAAYEEATRIDPEHAGAFAGLAASRLAGDDAEAGLAAYEEAVRLAPDHSGYHAARGRALRALSRLEEALGAYAQAKRLDPDNRAAARAHEELRRELRMRKRR